MGMVGHDAESNQFEPSTIMITDCIGDDLSNQSVFQVKRPGLAFVKGIIPLTKKPALFLIFMAKAFGRVGDGL